MPITSDIASVSSPLAWLVDPTNPTANPLTFGSRTQSDPVLNQDGELAQYSNGASQVLSYDTSSSAVSYVIVNITRADYLQLQQWIGKTLLLRTVDGERWFVAYLAVSPHRALRRSHGLRYDVTIQFYIVSYDESV